MAHDDCGMAAVKFHCRAQQSCFGQFNVGSRKPRGYSVCGAMIGHGNAPTEGARAGYYGLCVWSASADQKVRRGRQVLDKGARAAALGVELIHATSMLPEPAKRPSSVRRQWWRCGVGA